FESVKCPVCELADCDKGISELRRNSNFVSKDKCPYEAILNRMYRLSRRRVIEAIQPFYEQLLEWFEIAEKLVRLGREVVTVVQEWMNREREIISSCMRFEIGMKVCFPFTSRTVVLNQNNI
ncbi:hypothetical protein OSTOST_07409, partial [Ostertagia ostertagi]